MRSNRELSYHHQLNKLITEVRKYHPTLSCRAMYFKTEPQFMGRDKFEQFCKDYGWSSKRPHNFTKTTHSTGVIRFKNLIVGLKIKRLNQVWQSDITYFEVGGKFYYLTFILDSYSRYIVGYHVSHNLTTEATTLPALKMGLQYRMPSKLKGLILHSDGGGQYYDSAFLALTKDHGIINSMCQYAWENGKAERINGIIKNNYLNHVEIHSFEDLRVELKKAIHKYNCERPHSSLNWLSPSEFEQRIK